MSEGLITAAIAGAVGVGTIIGKLVSDYWANKTRVAEQQQSASSQDEERVLNYYKGELSHCRQETNLWRDFALSKVGDMEEVAEALKQLKNGGSS